MKHPAVSLQPLQIEHPAASAFDATPEIARQIERLFGTPYNLAEVSHVVKRVDDGLKATGRK
jgi:hypothetical protein